MNKLILWRRPLWLLNSELIFKNAQDDRKKKKKLLVFLVRMNSFLFFDMTAVLICVQNELVCVCLRRCCCWQSAVTVVKCSWKKKKKKKGKKEKKEKKKNARRGHSRQPDEKICRVLWCLCVKWLIALSTRRPFKITHFKKRKKKNSQRNGSCLQKRQTLTFLFSTSVTVATSEMSEMSFALKKKLTQTFKDTLDDCFNSSFFFFFFFWRGACGGGC